MSSRFIFVFHANTQKILWTKTSRRTRERQPITHLIHLSS